MGDVKYDVIVPFPLTLISFPLLPPLLYPPHFILVLLLLLFPLLPLLLQTQWGAASRTSPAVKKET